MPTQNQITTRPDAQWDSSGKFSDQAVMKQLFSASPVFEEAMDPAKLREKAVELLLRGTVQNGYGFSSFSRDYSDAPDYGAVETGGEGKPASAYVPNPASPGPGSMNPADIPAAPEGYGTTHAEQWGNGAGTDVSPSASSNAMTSAESIHSSLEKGKSIYTVNKGN